MRLMSEDCLIFETVDKLGYYVAAPTMPVLFAPWWGGGFADDEVSFHPGLRGGVSLLTLQLLMHPCGRGCAEAIVGDVDHTQRWATIFRAWRVVADQE